MSKYIPYAESIALALKHLFKKHGHCEETAQASVYYAQRANSVACASFERFKGSSAHSEWLKKSEKEIEKVRVSWRGYPHFAKFPIDNGSEAK